MAILNPAPRGPRMLPSGTLQSSRMMLAVDEALMPNLSSFFPRESPGCGMGTTNALIPCRHGRQKAGGKKHQRWGRVRRRYNRKNPLFICLMWTEIRWEVLRHCLVFELPVCGGEHNSGRRIPAVGDPGFGSIQHPLISLLMSCRGGSTCVAAITCSLNYRCEFKPVQLVGIYLI